MRKPIPEKTTCAVHFSFARFFFYFLLNESYLSEKTSNMAMLDNILALLTKFLRASTQQPGCHGLCSRVASCRHGNGGSHREVVV